MDSPAFACLNFPSVFNAVMFLTWGITWLGKGTVFVYNYIIRFLETENIFLLMWNFNMFSIVIDFNVF